jgi:hypothetical protein
MFHGFGSGVPSSSARWMHPGLQTCVTQKGPSQRGGGGELVQAFTGKYAPEHQIIHLELPTIHKPLVVAPERLLVSCISESCLPSSFIDKVNIITQELVLHDFIVCLNTGGDHGDLWGGGVTASAPYTKKKGVSLVA